MIIMAEPLIKSELEQLNLFINTHYGLDFRQRRLELLHDAVQRRSKVCKVSTVSEYLDILQQRREEGLRLINLLTVNETYFFREPTHFDVVTMQVIPRLIKSSGHCPFFRLLSAGCSTGEEAYSMAIAALSMPGAGVDWDFEVVGIDVDNEAIKKAQAGIYGPYSFRACATDIKNRYFEQVSGDKFTVKNFVRKKVRFEALNLFEQVYPDWLSCVDIIFYRNVSIYFSREQREEVFRRLTGLLNPDGCLFLSCTETLYHNNKLVSLTKSGKAFYYQKRDETSRDGLISCVAGPTDKKVAVAFKPQKNMATPVRKQPLKTVPHREQSSLSVQEQLPLVDNKNQWCSQLFAEALEQLKLKRYDEAIAQLDEIITIDSLFIKAYTLKANILLNRQDTDGANALCDAALGLDTFCLEAYLLLGMAAKVSGKLDESIQRFKQAVYVCPEGWLAHFFLAEVYQLRAENFYAKREYEVATNLLRQGRFEDHGLSFFMVPFQQEDFIQLCQHNLAKLKA